MFALLSVVSLMVLFVGKTGVVGAGVMGSQIAEIFAINGYEVYLKDVNMDLALKGVERIKQSLDKLVHYHLTKADKEIERIESRDGVKLTDEQKEQVRKNLRPTYDEKRREEILSKIKPVNTYERFGDIDLVIEAVIEDIDVKKRVFRELDEVCPERTILASNTSTLSITEIASATKRPGRVLGLHFFNPATVLPLVEVIPGLETREDVVEDVIDFLRTLRNERYMLQPIKVKETPGFLVNRILAAMLNEAYACYEEGVASPRDIDLAMKTGAGWPMGPFELSDLIGIDIIYHVQESLKKMWGGLPQWRPVQIIKYLYHAGRLGKKTGRGFYDYRAET